MPGHAQQPKDAGKASATATARVGQNPTAAVNPARTSPYIAAQRVQLDAMFGAAVSAQPAEAAARRPVVQRVQVTRHQVGDVLLLGAFAGNIPALKAQVIAQSDVELRTFLVGLTKDEQAKLLKEFGTEYRARVEALPPPPTLDEIQYNIALENNRADVAKVGTLLATGQADLGTNTADPKYGMAWPNSADWIGKGKTRVMALTKTHDTVARATAQGADPATNTVYFGAKDPVPANSTYNRTVRTAAADTVVLASTINGQQWPLKIEFVEPRLRTDESLKNTIVHEVQHDADKHAFDPLSLYVTEFRAYWLDQSFENESAVSGGRTVALDGHDFPFNNARQIAIFRHLYLNPVYAYVKTGWTTDPGFRASAIAYTHPESLNWANSARIDDLRETVQRFDPQDFVSGTTLDQVRTAANALNAADRAAIRSAQMTPQWNPLMAAFLAKGGQPAHDEIRAILDRV
jgi:hypothetical protein